MKFTSGHIVQASGSVGGLVYSHNRYGNYVRAKATPVNPGTARQTAVRSVFASLAEAWRDILTPAERVAWGTYALNTPIVDRLGRSQTLTGLNWYIACNSLRLQASLTRVDTAPALFGLADLTAPVFTFDASSTQVSTVFTNTDEWAGEVGGALLIFASAPKGPAINFFKGPFKYLGLIAGAVSPPTSPQVKTLADAVVAGQQAWGKAVAVRADGRISLPFWIGSIVVA